MPDQQTYLSIRCDTFSLLLATHHVEAVVAISKSQASEKQLLWQGHELVLMDLHTLLISKHAVVDSSEAIIIKQVVQQQTLYFAVLAGQVAAIEDIPAEAFSSFAQRQFSGRHYFDKAYIDPATQQCFYRLDVDVLTDILQERCS